MGSVVRVLFLGFEQFPYRKSESRQHVPAVQPIIQAENDKLAGAVCTRTV